MKSAVLYKAKDLRLEERPRPAPAADEVLVKIKAVGICGSDMHLYEEGRVGNAVQERALVLGHEAAGEVVEVGADVTALKVGDRVALEPGVPCRNCDFCKRGEYHLCTSVVFRGVPHVDGLFTEYVTSPADFAYKLPEHIDYIQGAMLEPLAVGLQAAEEGRVAVGESVAVFGSGPIGLSSLQAAIARGATNTIVVDVFAKRLQLAKELGATHVVNAAQGSAVDEIVRLTGGKGADVVLETAAAVPTVQQSLFAARRGGRVVFVGIPSQPIIPLDIVRIVRSRMKVSGCFRYVNQYPVALALAATGKVDVKSMVTHTFAMDELPSAIEFAIKSKDIAIKCAVTL